MDNQLVRKLSIKTIPWFDRIAFPLFSVLLFPAVGRCLKQLGWHGSIVILLQFLIPLTALVFFLLEWSRPSHAAPAKKISSSISLVVLAAIGIVSLSLVLRLYTLGSRPAWEDEMWTLKLVYGGSMLGVWQISLEDYWPPLHYLLLNIFCRMFDTSIVSLRLPSVFFGVATVALLPFAGKAIVGTRRGSLLAALLLGTSVSHVFYSQEARVYSLQVFLAVLSAFTLHRSLERERFSVVYVVSTVLLLYSHIYSWFFIAFQFIYIAIVFMSSKPRKRLRNIMAAQVAVLLLYLPLVAGIGYIRLLKGIGPPAWAPKGRWSPSLIEFLDLYASLTVRSFVGAAFLAVLIGFALKAWAKSRRNTESLGENASECADIPFLLCWILVPALASGIASIITPLLSFGPIKYHLMILPGLYLLAGSGICRLKSRINMALAFALALVVGGGDLMEYYREYDHAHFDEAARYVRVSMSEGDQIYVGNAFRVFSYYFNDKYPRLGSAEWESFDREFEDLKDKVLENAERHGTHYLGKIPAFIYFINEPAAFEQELRDGKVNAPFWLVLRDPGEREVFTDTLERYSTYSLDTSVEFKQVWVSRFVRADASKICRQRKQNHAVEAFLTGTCSRTDAQHHDEAATDSSG